jgi:hypothetical protein
MKEVGAKLINEEISQMKIQKIKDHITETRTF